MNDVNVFDSYNIRHLNPKFEDFSVLKFLIIYLMKYTVDGRFYKQKSRINVHRLKNFTVPLLFKVFQQ